MLCGTSRGDVHAWCVNRFDEDFYVFKFHAEKSKTHILHFFDGSLARNRNSRRGSEACSAAHRGVTSMHGASIASTKISTSSNFTRKTAKSQKLRFCTFSTTLYRAEQKLAQENWNLPCGTSSGDVHASRVNRFDEDFYVFKFHAGNCKNAKIHILM